MGSVRNGKEQLEKLYSIAKANYPSPQVHQGHQDCKIDVNEWSNGVWDKVIEPFESSNSINPVCELKEDNSPSSEPETQIQSNASQSFDRSSSGSFYSADSSSHCSDTSSSGQIQSAGEMNDGDETFRSIFGLEDVIVGEVDGGRRDGVELSILLRRLMSGELSTQTKLQNLQDLDIESIKPVAYASLLQDMDLVFRCLETVLEEFLESNQGDVERQVLAQTLKIFNLLGSPRFLGHSELRSDSIKQSRRQIRGYKLNEILCKISNPETEKRTGLLATLLDKVIRRTRGCSCAMPGSLLRGRRRSRRCSVSASPSTTAMPQTPSSGTSPQATGLSV